MTNDEKLMAQALKALDWISRANAMDYEYRIKANEVLPALRERLAQSSEMDEAIAAGDGTLHGAIDYWQERAFKAEARLAQKDEPSTEPVAYRLHKTDIYDFAGWLTTRPGVMPVGSCSNAAPVADAVDEYIRKFPERFTAPPPRTPLTDEEINDEMDRLLLSPVEQEAFGSGVRYAERKHGIGEKG